MKQQISTDNGKTWQDTDKHGVIVQYIEESEELLSDYQPKTLQINCSEDYEIVTEVLSDSMDGIFVVGQTRHGFHRESPEQIIERLVNGTPVTT